jgi:hypothetical protein
VTDCEVSQLQIFQEDSMNPVIVSLLVTWILTASITWVVWRRLGFTAFAVGIMTFLMSMILMTSMLSTIEPETIVFDHNWKVKTTLPKGATVWFWSSLRSANQVRYNQRWLSVPMKVAPITDNPKVRGFRYTVTIEVMGSP